MREGRRQDALSKTSSDSRSKGLECLRVCKWRYKSVGQRRLPVNEKEYTIFIIVDNAWVERRWLVVVVGVLWAVVGL